MRINLIAVGKKMPEWISEGIEHYKKQLPKNYNFVITSSESQSRKSNSPEITKSLEAKLISKNPKYGIIRFNSTQYK